MPKRVRFLAVSLFFAIVGIMCVALAMPKAHALGGYKDYEAYDGDGWSITADGVMTIESNQGWANCIKDGYKPEVMELVIGKDVTYFRLYQLPYDLPSPDFFDSFETAEYDKNGRSQYGYYRLNDLFPRKISVDDENGTFQVIDGLLINQQTGELVLSETGMVMVVIPKGVRSITRKAFYQRDLISVQFPSSLETIGEYAFARCTEIKSVSLPNSVVELKQGAFYDCTNLQRLSLPQNLTVIADSAFGYSAIQQIEIPAQVTKISFDAFLECDKLQKVVLPDGLKRIESGAFGSCDQLSSINLPNGLEYIGRGAFEFCKSLKVVILPDSVQQVGDALFWGCDLSVLRIPSKLAFPIYSEKKRAYILNVHTKRNKSFELSSVDTVILAGSDYDFGYPAISNAKNVYFLGTPPEDVGQILDRETVENIYCSDEFEFQWTRSTVASWVRQRLQILPATKLNEQVESIVNATPEPTVTPRPTASPKPTRTPAKTRKPKVTPTQEPSIETTQDTDPILFVFAGVLALVIAGIVVVAVKASARNKESDKRRKTAR